MRADCEVEKRFNRHLHFHTALTPIHHGEEENKEISIFSPLLKNTLMTHGQKTS